MTPAGLKVPRAAGEAPVDALRPMDHAEPVLALMFSIFLAIAWLGWAGYQLVEWNTRHTERLIAAWVGWAVVLVLMICSFRFFAMAIKRAGHPAAVSIALRQPRWPMVLRPLASLWWLANAIAMVVLSHNVVEAYSGFGSDAQQRLFKYVATVGVLFASMFGANSYVLLSIAALTRSETVLRAAWRVRVPLDLAIACLVPTFDLNFL